MSGICKIFSTVLRNQCNSLKYAHLRPIIRHTSKFAKLSPFDKSFIIVRVCPRDYDRVLDLFRNSFFNEEPTMIAAGLAYKYNPVIEGWLLKCLEQGMSLMALCRRTGFLVGAAVNTGICPWDPEGYEEFASTCTCHKVAEWFRLYAHLERSCNLWERYNEVKIFEITSLSVDLNNQSRQIGYYLVKRSIDFAKDLSFNLVSIECTNFYTQKICKKLNMTMVHELPYKKYVDCDGKPVFLPPPPHENIQVFITLPHANKK